MATIALLHAPMERQAAAQSLDYFRALGVPPATVGTCAPVAARPRADGLVQIGSRLVMTNRSPNRHREMQVLVDGAGQLRLYSEFNSAPTGRLTSESDNIVAMFDEKGGIKGFRGHHTMQVPEGSTHPDPAAVRAKCHTGRDAGVTDAS